MARRKRKRENPLSARTIYGCDGHAMRNHVCMQCGGASEGTPIKIGGSLPPSFVSFVSSVRPPRPRQPSRYLLSHPSFVSSIRTAVRRASRRSAFSARSVPMTASASPPRAARRIPPSLLPSLVLSPPHSERESSRRRWLQPSSPSSPPPPPPPPPTPPSAQPSAPSPSADLGATAPWMRRRLWRPQVLTPCPLSPDRATG